MKLGVHIGYWGLGLTSQDQLTVVQEAERLGYDSVWAAEAYGSDAATVLACSPEATRTRNGGPGADIGNYSRSLPEPSTAPPIPAG